jgi:NodT family efflux transporter outer membrane factor (OMF) lipoprotein
MSAPPFPSRWRKLFPSLAALFAVTTLAGCAVGPDFERPPPPNITAYEAVPLPEKTESAPSENGEAQSFASGDDIPAEWWTLFHSEPLNQLIAQALKTNPDLDAASAALREAHENMKAGEGAFFPSVDAGFGAEREKLSGLAFGANETIPPFTLYNASVSVSYGPDLFGGTRRQVEALEAAEDYQRFELEAARITLTANVVTAAVQEASLRAQIAATQKIIDDEQKQLALLQNQLRLGGIAKSAVLAQAATLAQARSSLPPLEEQLAQTRHQLSVLAGQFPNQEPAGTFELTSLTLPSTVPVSMPSKLVEQRPDIRAAEATLHAASAEIGVATANMLPQITLSGNIGEEAGLISSFFTPGTGIWSLAAGVTQPLFRGGTLLHQKRASEAAYDQAAAQYRKTVLVAFQNVADSLHALQSDADALKADADAEHAAADSLSLSEQQYKDGAISYLALLTAEQTEQQTRLALVQAEARRFADTAALFTALGGGWWNRVPDDAETSADQVTQADDNQPMPPVTNIHSSTVDSNKTGDQ